MSETRPNVICRWEDRAGHFNTDGFDLHGLVNPVIVTITHCGTKAAETSAQLMRDVLVNELTVMGAKAAAITMGNGFACDALTEPERRKLLVMVGDDATAFQDADKFAPWRSDDRSFAALPAFPIAAKPNIWSLLPSWVRLLNVVFWTADPQEVRPAMLSVSGITPESPRIFISYRQVESAGLAIQLFDALGEAGFDVFLDHYRIPPGVDFQARLAQELGEKSMVMFLESATFGKSEWITYEVNTAKACGLGICALNLCGAPKTDGVDEAVRTSLDHTHFLGDRYDDSARLKADVLAKVLTMARTEHDRAIVRRRHMLEDALEGALLRQGGKSPTRFGDGCLQVESVPDDDHERTDAKRYIVALTPRPPDLPDFQRCSARAVQPAVGVVVGLSRLMEPLVAERFTWLSGVTKLKFRDEGQILDLARQLVKGTL